MSEAPRFRSAGRPHIISEIILREVSYDAQDLETPNILISIKSEGGREWNLVVSYLQLDDLVDKVERNSRVRRLL